MRISFHMCLLFLCAPGIALAQQTTVPGGAPAQSSSAPAPQAQAKDPQLVLRPPPKPEGTEGKIQLDVFVTGKQGAPVPGLDVKDFTILDNKKSQDIVSFHAVDRTAGTADPSVEIILLLDLVNSTFEQAATARDQIRKFLEQNGGHLAYPTSIMVLTQQGLRIQHHPTTDGNALITMLGQSDTAVHSAALGQGERFQLSVRSLASIAENETKSPRTKILIWTGAGWPMLVGSNVASSTQDRERTFDAIVEISTRLRESHIALYSIPLPGSATAGMPTVLTPPHGGAMPGAEAPQQSHAGPVMSDTAEGANYKEFLRGVKSAHQADPGDLALQVFAVQSGGRILEPGNDLAGQIAKCVEDLSALYILSFNPAHAEHENDYHDLKVQVSRPGLAARTNTGYYNQP